MASIFEDSAISRVNGHRTSNFRGRRTAAFEKLRLRTGATPPSVTHAAEAVSALPGTRYSATPSMFNLSARSITSAAADSDVMLWIMS